MYWIGVVRSGDNQAAFALIVENVLFVHKIFCIIHPFFFPALLLEVLKLETWMKD
jgi:hypothetical protein